MCEQCTWQWTQRNGVYGQLLTGPNGNTLFLPAAGYRWEDSLYYAGSYGVYWSRSLHSGDPGYAGTLGFGSGSWGSWDYNGRYFGFAVRAVRVS